MPGSTVVERMIPTRVGEVVTVLAGLVAVVGVPALTLFGPLIFLLYVGTLPEPVIDALESLPVWAVILAVVALSFGAAAGFLAWLSRADPLPDWL